jgi:hypothetical protein
MLDNEAPRAFLDVIEENGLEWELVPPHNHRRNVAERAIQTAKGHIIANVLGCDPTFPLKEWHRILPQIELTLNMLRPSNVRQTVSAHTYVYGQHDYNRMPLAPLGCATQCFAANTQRLTFGAHSMDSWYIGTSNEHYRCQKVFLKETRAERITDTIIFHHKRITCPTVSAADAIVAAANNLNQTIQNNMKESLTNVDMNELDRLANIFQEAAQKISEADARQPRVPRRNDTTRRGCLPTMLRSKFGGHCSEGGDIAGRRTKIHDTQSKAHSRLNCNGCDVDGHTINFPSVESKTTGITQVSTRNVV